MDNKFAFLDNWTISDQDRAYYMMTMSLDEPYKFTSDSLKQEGVPEGKVIQYHMPDCKTYPGVARDYWVYVPQQYKACADTKLIVYLDGYKFIANSNATIAMDNLIYKNEMPVCIAVFVGPGDKGPGYPIYGGTDNRSIEYDSADEVYGRFLIEEIIPKLKEEYTFSDDPDDHMIIGMSSSGNAAFSAAWHWPDTFRKVISHCGSFTNMRGGHKFPVLVRTSEKKPIKVWLCTGEKDLDTVFGSWKIANEYMASSLAYRGYEYKFYEGVGGHSWLYGGMLLPDAMRWMWNK